MKKTNATMTTSAVRKIFELIEKYNMSLKEQRKLAKFMKEELPCNASDVEELYFNKFLEIK